jgi:hypothetical protein
LRETDCIVWRLDSATHVDISYVFGFGAGGGGVVGNNDEEKQAHRLLAKMNTRTFTRTPPSSSHRQLIGPKDNFSNMTLSKAQKLVRTSPAYRQVYGRKPKGSYIAYKQERQQQSISNNNNNNSTPSFHGTTTWLQYQNPSLEDIWDTTTNDMEPEIFVFNAGLHLLHFQGHGRDKASWDAVKKWIQYEDILLEQLDRVIQHNLQRNDDDSRRIRALVFKTSNRVCEDKYVGAYKEAAQLFNEADPQVLSNCRETIQQLLRNSTTAKNKNFSTAVSEVDNYCENSTLTERGASHLNDRLYRFVQLQNQIRCKELETANLQLAILEAHDIQSCQYTPSENGRHYFGLNLMRLRLFANLLQALA